MKREITLKVAYNHPYDQDSFILNLVCRAIAENVDNGAAVTTVTAGKMPMTVRFLSNGEPVTTDELADFFELCPVGALVEIVQSGDKYRSWEIIKMLEVR